MSSRWPLFIARAVTLAGFVLTILAGLFGSVVGSHNFAIIFVWIAWWTLLKLVFIPLGGRSWCAVCPIPMPGEWLAQGGIFPARQKKFGLGLRWPRKIGPLRLDGAWLQAGGFLIVGLFSAVTLTTPRLTGWVLLGILILATGLALVFEGRDRAQLASRGAFLQSPVSHRRVYRAVCPGRAAGSARGWTGRCARRIPKKPATRTALGRVCRRLARQQPVRPVLGVRARLPERQRLGQPARVWQRLGHLQTPAPPWTKPTWRW